ncbi:MAG: hypothetical protein K2N94_10335 [Lachnospiraceae bacterium]|nr:hypothetical protein [Lachnospiraceae bacterium]
MKLKYYLRGVGVGLILAVVLYSVIIIPRKYELSEEEIIKRAQELGMERRDEGDVDLSALTVTPEPDEPEGTPEPSPEPTPTPEPTPAPPSPPDSPQAPSGLPEPDGPEEITPEPTQGLSSVVTQGPDGPEKATPAPTQEADDGSYTIRIFAGMDSEWVSRLVQEAGLVDDAADFDRYLVENGYSQKIMTDIFRIPAGASYEEIARIITRQ